MKKMKPCKVNSKILPLQATNDLFAKISSPNKILRLEINIQISSRFIALGKQVVGASGASGGWEKNIKNFIVTQNQI